MSDNIRIKTTPGGDNKFLKVKIKQDFDFIEILSLRISQNQAYRRFCSDYGVVVGRVSVNNGLGIPNVRVSIFIPIDSDDAIDPEIFGIYPFEIITDKDSDGLPYNLLPKNSRGKDDCYTTIGTFPTKREIQDNPEISDIYCKYYKYTTTTNDSGDFMIFGVPLGAHYLHVDGDISDIGIFSQKPYELINDGANTKSFQSPTKYKNNEQTTTLSQLKRFSPISVSVIPFWGDTEQCEVGISRNDVDLRVTITPSALFVGSIISDSGKNSLGKSCVPREDMGKHSQLSTGSGSIEMIRKTRGGGTERFDAGQVIDDNGTWAYLIPMNLNYVITSEEGKLIPSDDPTRGIPTTSNVRFRIGMDTNGSEGQSTTRAKYLVPNNPSGNKIDYNFDSSTDNSSFTELIWNEIYTIKNYIARVQVSTANIEERQFVAIKDVDEGPFAPFPFNKLDVDINPLFGLICLFLNIFVTIICAFNLVIIPLINTVLAIINGVLITICVIVASVSIVACAFDTTGPAACRCRACLSDACDPNDTSPENCINACGSGPIIPYIPYITLTCDSDTEGRAYAPCGTKTDIITGGDTLAWTATNIDSQTQNFHYPEDGDGHGIDAGWIDCVAIGLAKSLDVFKFDFYNDWVNGTLYSYLFSVKIDGDSSKFCDTDCGETTNFCRNTFIFDTCTEAPPGSNSTGVFNPSGIGGATYTGTYKNIFEGLIKRHNGQFYYVPKSVQKGNKLYATDIVSLGSMIDCHWKGIPNIHKYFTDTTYNIPPLVAEYDINNNIETTGFDTDIGNDTSLIGNVICLPGIAGILTDNNNCVNIRRLSELGVGLDENRDDESPPLGNVNNRIDNNDVDSPYIRGAFAFVNSSQGGGQFNEILFDDGSDFGEDNQNYYSEFRGYRTRNDIKERDNSFYFYFGLINGNGAITKMNKNFFTECTPEDDTDFIVIGDVKSGDDGTSTQPTGEIEINILNGRPPYDISWDGPTVNMVQFINNVSMYAPNAQTQSNLYSGTYNVRVIDSLNRVAEGSFYVPGPDPNACDVQVTNVSQNNASDGKVTVTIQNGIPPYDVVLSQNGSQVATQINLPLINNTASHIFPGLTVGTYDVTVTDSASPSSECKRTVIISEPNVLNVSATGDTVSCFGENDGRVTVIVNGGTVPYVIEWKDSIGNTVGTGMTINNLSPGTYTVTVTDNNGSSTGQQLTSTYTVTEPIDITYSVTSVNIGCKGFSTGQISVFNVNSENDVRVTLTRGSSTNILTSQIVSNSNGTGVISTTLSPGTYLVKLEDIGTGCIKISGVFISEPTNPLSVNLIQNSTTFTTTASGGWGNEPVNNPAQNNVYKYTWQTNIGGNMWISYPPPNQVGTYSNGVGTSVKTIPNLTTGTEVRCRVRAYNGTSLYCEKFTNIITV